MYSYLITSCDRNYKPLICGYFYAGFYFFDPSLWSELSKPVLGFFLHSIWFRCTNYPGIFEIMCSTVPLRDQIEIFLSVQYKSFSNYIQIFLICFTDTSVANLANLVVSSLRHSSQALQTCGILWKIVVSNRFGHITRMCMSIICSTKLFGKSSLTLITENLDTSFRQTEMKGHQNSILNCINVESTWDKYF